LKKKRVELILQGKQVDRLNQIVKEYSEEISQLKMDVQAYDKQITSKCLFKYLLKLYKKKEKNEKKIFVIIFLRMFLKFNIIKL